MKIKRRNSTTPPAVIINLAYTGLGLARSLGRRGVPVIGLVSGPGQYGRFSRYCTARVCPSCRSEQSELLQHLIDLGRSLDEPAVLFPTSDFDLLLISRNREALAPYFRIPMPSPAVVEAVMDKAELCRRATQCGVPVPEMLVCRNIAEIRAASTTLRYPCVVKPVHSYVWHEGNNWDVVGQGKAFKANCADELEALYQRVSRANTTVLVQEFVPGDDRDVFVAGVYMAGHAEPRVSFTARKLIQLPRQFGTGCVVQHADNQAVLSLAVQLLKHLDYSGIAEVEFKWDQQSQSYKLIEVNPRFWDWHSLSIATGVDLGYAAYAEITGQDIPPPRRPTPGLYWIAEEGLLLAMRQSAMLESGESSVSLRQLLRSLFRRRIWGYFAWDDTVPFLHFALDQLRLRRKHLQRRLSGRGTKQSATEHLDV